MIVHKPLITCAGDEVRVEAAIELKHSDLPRPSTLWFALPNVYQNHVTDWADGFAVALLPLAMRLGEPMRIVGELSSRLAAGMREYQRIQSAWKPGFFTQVEVQCERLRTRDPGEASGAVGVAFSGGVDSSYSLWSHLAENEPYPTFRVSHCLMINGFDEDSDLSGPGRFLPIQRLYETAMARQGVGLLVVRTNLLQILGYEVRKQSFAAFLTATALVLGRLFSRLFVSSGHNVPAIGMYRDGSHLMLDHLLTSETMETIHDGAHATRVDKTVAISRWPETYDLLRVCFHATGVQEGRDAIANCCRCEKCIRTMTTLEIAGSLANYRCFRRPLDQKIIRDADFSSPAAGLFTQQIIDFAVQAGRRDIARDLRHAFRKSRCFRRPIGRIARASFRLEGRSRLWAAIVSAPKRLLKRVGWGRGWLY